MSAPRVLVVDDDAGIRTVLAHALSRESYDVQTVSSAADTLRVVRAGDCEIVLTDVILPDGSGLDVLSKIKTIRPDLPVVVMSAQNTFVTAITAAERGAYEYLPKPFDLDEMLGLVRRALAEPRLLSEEAEGRPRDDMPLIGRSPAMQEVYRILARVMQTDLTVLVTGESGTGKELIARALHDYGRRKNRAFVAVNMAAIPRDLIEAELFGHEKGAFTGAAARAPGRFEQADGGTLFLDEIGDMPMEAQTRLLRVLQEGEYTTVGGRTTRKVDVRIVAATNQSLPRRIDEGRFREDLYYRLNVVPLRLPSLRERVEDIPELCEHFLRLAAQDGLPRRRLGAEALERLVRHGWPGNVRELRNLVGRLAIMSIDEEIDGELVDRQLADEVDGAPPAPAAESTIEDAVRGFATAALQRGDRTGLYGDALARMERALLATVMAEARGNQLRAAAMLGVNRNTLRKKLSELDIAVRRSPRTD